MKHVSENVRRIRESRNWSQEQLAEMAGMTVRTIQRIESGQRVAEETLQDVAIVFEIDRGVLDIDTEALVAEIDAEVAQLKADSIEIVLHRVDHGHQLCPLLDAGAYMGDCQTSDSIVRDVAASFEAAIQDEIDMWKDYGREAQREVEKQMDVWIARFAELGFSLYAGNQQRSIKTDPSLPPLRFSVLLTSLLETTGRPFYKMLLPKKFSFG